MKKNLRKDNFVTDCKWLYSKSLSHRGLFDNVSVYENTINSYKASLDKKMAIELDVQLTNDHEVICMHDTNLKRFFNRTRDVNDITYKRLNKLRDDLQVPLLKDVLKLIDGKVGVMVELKHVNSKFDKILVKKVSELLKEYKGNYVVVSFNPFMLRKYRKLDKDAYIGRIFTSNGVKGFNKFVTTSKILDLIAKPDFISCDVNGYDSKRLEAYKQKGYKIIGWPIKDKSLEKNLKKHFDSFIIEY